MNRNLFQAASAAFLCFALAACGGGGGSDPSPAPSTPPTSTPTAPTNPPVTGSTTTDTSTGGKVSIGDNTPAVTDPGDGNSFPIPNCTPKQVVVALLGDGNMKQLYYTGQLQKDLDHHFGAGTTLVKNYALAGDLSNTYLYIDGDVIIENYGISDMTTGIAPSELAKNIVAMRTTLVMTQTPISSIYDPTPYLNEAMSVGLPVADAYTYMNSLITADTTIMQLTTDGEHPTDDTLIKIVDNVVAPAVFKQVAPLRCQLG